MLIMELEGMTVWRRKLDKSVELLLGRSKVGPSRCEARLGFGEVVES
jgi:hypothetical protein